MWTGIILLTIAIIFFFIPIIFKKKIKYHPDWLVYLIFVCAVIGSAFFVSDIQEKETTIDCLKGNFPYKQIIQYRYEGNELLSQDTIYIKKENHEKQQEKNKW